MAKADLLKWILAHSPPLMGTCPIAKNPPYAPDDQTDGQESWTFHKTDYNRFNAVTTEAEARAALTSRVPPLTVADVEAGMVEYLK